MASVTNNQPQEVLCRTYRSGTCTYGARCHYKHTDCTYGLKCYRQTCRYGHPKEWQFAGTRLPSTVPTSKAVVAKDNTSAKPHPRRAVQGDRKESLENIIKFVKSQKARYLPPSNQYSIRVGDVGYQFKVKKNGSRYMLEQSVINEGVLPEVAIKQPLVFYAQGGLFEYDPDEMYLPDHQVFVTLDLNLQPIAPIQVPMPTVDGATYFKIQGSTLLFFVPYKLSINKVYYKKIVIYSYNHDAENYVFSHEIEEPNFHIISVSATSKFLALSRLPFNPNEAILAYHLEQNVIECRKTIDSLTAQLQVMQNEVAALKRQLQQQIDAQRQREADQQREMERLRLEAIRAWEASNRSRDPFDFWVMDSEQRKWVKVIDFPKPADEVGVSVIDGTTLLHVYVDGYTHEFEVVVKTSNIAKRFSSPLRPDKIWPTD